MNITLRATDDGADIALPTVSGWTSSGDRHTATIAYRRDGLYTFDIDVTDKAGNTSADFTEQTFYVDTTAPTLEITGVADRSANNGDIIPVVSYSDTNYDDAQVNITLTGAMRKGVALDGSYADQHNGKVFTFKNFAKEKEVDDIYTLAATLTDKAGNTTEKTILFSANRFGSTYALSAATDQLNGSYVQTPQDVVVTETNPDALQNIRITLFKNNQTIILQEGTDYRIEVRGGNGQWYEYIYTVLAKNFADDGVYRLTFYSEDAAGNIFKNEDLSLKERNQWFRVDVITCAAPILFMLPHTNSAVLGDLFRSRIRNIFNAAIDNDIRVLILGAFGCGAFKNPPEIVAQAFRDVLLEEHYDTCFTDIVFAIKSSNGNDPFKPCPNLMAFQLAFDGLSTEAAKLRFSGPMWLVDDAPTPEKIRQEELSQWKTTNLYRGKQFSVLGDSVSTLESYNPPDHSVFYKGDVCSRTGVYTMADTWWGQVIDFFGGELLVNDSWSGSRVTKLPGQHELFPSGCSDQRTSHLHMRGVRPDVILVYLGTNDWANAVRPMEDGGVTDEWYSVFETAYRRMLQKLRANYPDAELWCCTLCSTYMSTDPAFVFPESVGGISIEVYNDIIRRTAVLEGGRLIDLYAYHLPYDAIDGSHPTKTGMERLAKLVLREMLGKEADAILDCRNGQHEYMALEEGTDETRYVCRCCGKLLTVKNWKLLTQKERRPIPDDSEYVMLPPDTTVVLYSDVLPLTIPSTGEKLQIKKPMVTVGRASDSDVRLSARTVARRQAAFFYEQEIWFVRDNFSTNGTWINGRKLIPGKKYQLAAYDEIGFARTEKVIFDLRNESYTPPRQETPPRPMGDFAGEKRIGEYEVIRALAPLSVKDVYLAKSSRTDRLVVLKPCRKDDRPAQKAIRELLLKEADLLRQLDHPAIPKLVEVLEDEETLCVVREYFDGETLESVMAREGTQDLIQVVDWAWQLCDVLRYLHERNYVYRDMKPGNILLRPDGRLALIDFGTMRVYKPGKAGDTVCLGTRGYAAPEQFGGMGQTDARTDIYGLGATLYYLATGCNPGVPPYEIDCIHAMYIDGFPHQLGDLIQKCVQPDPVRRFQSCRELMEALEDASFDVTTNQEKLAQWKRILRREEQS